MAATTYVRERKSAVGFREYLNDLAERDADETYSRYSFPRFVTGILPILGLLGTVVHFGSALSGLSSDDLTSKVPQIVSGMVQRLIQLVPHSLHRHPPCCCDT